MKSLLQTLLCFLVMATAALAVPHGALAQEGPIEPGECAYCRQHSTSGTNQFKCDDDSGNMKCRGTAPGGFMCLSCKDDEVSNLPQSMRVGPDGFLVEEPRLTALLQEGGGAVGEFSATGRWVVRDPCSSAIVAQVPVQVLHAELIAFTSTRSMF